MIRRGGEPKQRPWPGARVLAPRGWRILRAAALLALALPTVAAAAGRPVARPQVIAGGILHVATASASPATGRARGVVASHPQQVATYPRQGQTHIPPSATLYFVFDQPTLKSGSFSVADLDNLPGLIPLGIPRWSALGDTVFLTPLTSLAMGHYHGMRVNTIFATDGTASNDLPIVYFTIVARASIAPLAAGAESRTVALAPGAPTPVGLSVSNRVDTEVRFDHASVTFVTPSGAVLDSTVEQVALRVPRSGVADLSIPVAMPASVARTASQGRLSLRLAYYGVDETLIPFTFVTTLGVQVAPAIASNAVIQSAVLEWPLHGAAVAAGDTLLPRAVVTGTGTGPFRGAFILDGEVFAIEEGYLEAGRPAVVTPRGPIPTRRLGEHRLQFTVESPQVVAARPVSFACVPPAHGLSGPPPTRTRPGGEAAAPQRLSVSGTFLAEGQTKYRSEGASATGWGFGSARYDLQGGAALEASTSVRVRADDPKNGTARPEQVRLRLFSQRGSLEWSDAAPALAQGAPLFASAVPRRAAQGRWEAPSIGTFEGYVALNSRPGGSGGPVDQPRSDLYAGRFTRELAAGRASVSAYGGYTHEDPTPGGLETLVRARSIVGGTGRVRLAGDWSLLADAAAVHHKAAAGAPAALAADPTLAAHTRAGWRSELSGSMAGVKTLLQAFRYQADLASALNPYALSNRVGGAAELSRAILHWRMFAGFRSEQPAERVGLAPVVRVDNLRFGGTLTLNQCSSVEPAIVLVTHHGANTEYKESRFQTQFTRCEPGGGQTSVRLDAATYQDDLAANARRRVLSGSLVSTVRHSAGATSTLSAGYEEDTNRDLDQTNRTIQGTFETRFEALPGRLLITPYFTGSSRDYEQFGTKEVRLGGRLQIALLRFAGLGENALALTGRVDRLKQQIPSEKTSTEGAIDLTWGQRFDW